VLPVHGFASPLGDANADFELTDAGGELLDLNFIQAFVDGVDLEREVGFDSPDVMSESVLYTAQVLSDFLNCLRKRSLHVLYVVEKHAWCDIVLLGHGEKEGI